MTDLHDRYLGCLLGLATGTTLEFNTPGSFTPIADITLIRYTQPSTKWGLVSYKRKRSPVIEMAQQ